MTQPVRWLRRRIHGAGSVVFLLVLCASSRAVGQTLLPPDPAVTIGNVVPFDGFVDEKGQELGDLGTPRAWIVSPIYTRCLYTCLPITAALRSALAQSGLRSDEYRVVSFSFDPNETAESLAALRHKMELPPAWLTLRARDRDALARTLKALDFRTITIGDGQFEHPNLIAILTPDRRLASYLFGVTFSPSQLAAAVRSARGGVSLRAGWAAPVFAIAAAGLVASAFVVFTLLSKRRVPQLPS